MIPLETNRRVLTLLCLYPADKTASIWQKLFYILFTILIFTINTCALISSMAFFVTFVTSDLESSLHALLQMCALSSAMYMNVLGLYSRYKFTAIFNTLNKLYKMDENKDTFRFLVKANSISEFISRNYLFYTLSGFFVNTLMMSGVSVLICHMMYGTFDPTHVYHAFKILVPWNETTLIGYFWEVCYDAILGNSYLFANSALLLFFISICLHHQEFANRIEYSLRRSVYDKTYLCNLIRFHTSIKEWFRMTADIYSHMIMYYLVCNTVYLACVAFELDTQVRKFSFSIIIMLISVVVGVSNMFVYCFFGRLATESYAKMANSIYEANWPNLPVNLQKYFILMIGNAQRSLFYHGFFATLNLETFTKLLKTVFTYYMLFKTLTE